MPAQPIPNPNNKNPQKTYMIEGQQFLTYLITPLDLSNVQLRSGRILEKRKPSVIIQEQDNFEEDSLRVNKSLEEDTSFQDPQIEKLKQKDPINPTLVLEQPSTSTSRTVSRSEIGHMLDDFKSDILGSLSEQIDTLKIQNKQKLNLIPWQSFVPNVERNMP